MARPRASVITGIHRFVAVAVIIKLLFVAVFLFVFPAMCMVHGMAGAGILLGLLGLFLDVQALDVLLTWAGRWTAALRKLALLYHGSIVLAAVVLVAQPIDPRWTKVAGSEDRSSVVVTWLKNGGLVVGGHDRIDLQVHADDGSVRSLDYPGLPAWVMFTDRDDNLWLAPDAEPTIHVLDSQGWSQIPRPVGHVRAMATRGSVVWLVTDSLYTHDRTTHRWDRPDITEWPTGVAVAPDEREVLVVGRRNWRSSSDGEHWDDVTPVDASRETYHDAAIGGGDWRYAYGGGFWSSTLHVRGPTDTSFIQRALPIRDIRVLVADPVDGRRIWIGAWGEGIFHSPDGGATWQNLGLRRIQTSGLAVDFTRGRVAVGCANMMFDKGAYVRPTTP